MFLSFWQNTTSLVALKRIRFTDSAILTTNLYEFRPSADVKFNDSYAMHNHNGSQSAMGRTAHKSVTVRIRIMRRFALWPTNRSIILRLMNTSMKIPVPRRTTSNDLQTNRSLNRKIHSEWQALNWTLNERTVRSMTRQQLSKLDCDHG